MNLIEEDSGSDMLLESVKVSQQLMGDGGDSRGGQEPSDMLVKDIMNHNFTEEEMADDANAIIRMSHAGWVDKAYFEAFIVPAMNDTVQFN